MTATLLNYSSLVTPLVSQLPSTVVLSGAFTVSVATTLVTTYPGAQFLINGSTYSANTIAGPGSQVQVQATTSSAFNTAIHVPFTANGVTYTFSASTLPDSTVSGIQSPSAISLTDANVIARLTTWTTNYTTVRGINQSLSVPVSVPAIFGAAILKNGSNVGSATTAMLGDLLAVTFTAPATYGSKVQIPLFVGNTYDYFFATTTPANDVPVGFPPAPTVGAAFGTLVTSSSVTVSGLDTDKPVVLTIDTGSIVKNGVDVSGLTTNIVNGDTISFKLTSPASPNYDATNYLKISVGATYKSYWSVTALSSLDPWIVTSLAGRALYDTVPGLTSVAFNGTTDYLTLANNSAYAMPGAFTIEFWMKPSLVSSGQIMGTHNNGANQWAIALSSTYGLYFYYGVYGAYKILRYIPPANAPQVNVWTHVAIVRNSSYVWTFYINGVATTTVTFAQNIAFSDTVSYPANTMYVAGGGAGSYKGQLANIRVVVGTAVYASNFTITNPVEVPKAISGTSLLLLTDGMTDASVVASPVVKYGNPTIIPLDSPSSPPAAALNSNNSLYRIDTTSHSVLTTTSLYNPAVTADATLSTFLYSQSFYENLTYKVNLAGVVTQSIANPTGYTVYDSCYVPKVSVADATTVTKRWIAIYGSGSGKIRDTSGVNADLAITAGTVPYGLDSNYAGDIIYAALSDNTLAKIVLNTGTGLYAVSSYIALGGSVYGGLRQVAVDSSGKVWVVDVYNNRVVVIGPTDTIVASVALPVGTDPWDITVDNNLVGWVAGSYSNSLVRIDTSFSVTAVQCSGVPCAVAVDPNTGYVWVGHYGSNYINIFDPSTLVRVYQITLTQPVSSLSYDAASGSMWAQCLYKDLATYQNRLTLITAPDAVVFTPVVDVPVGSSAQSNLVTVSGLANKPSPVSVPPNLGVSLSVNGGSSVSSAMVKNGDTLRLSETPVSNSLYTTNSLALLRAGSRMSAAWSARTVGSHIPLALYFDNDEAAVAGSLTTSGIATITGLSPGISVNIYLSDPDWGIIVNGAPAVLATPVPVSLGDSVQLVGTPLLPSTATTITVTGDIGPSPTVATILGTFTLYTVSGAIPTSDIINAPAKYVPMFYQKGVRNVHISLSDDSSWLKASIGTKSLVGYSYVTEGVSVQYTPAPSPVSVQRTQPRLANTAEAEAYVASIRDFDLGRVYDSGRSKAAYIADAVSATRGNIPTVVEADAATYAKGKEHVYFEADPQEFFEVRKRNLGTLVDAAYLDSTFHGFYEADPKLVERWPSFVHEVSVNYEKSMMGVGAEVPPSYIKPGTPTVVEIAAREYVHNNSTSRFDSMRTAELYQNPAHAAADPAYIIGNNTRLHEAPWLPGSTRARSNSKFLTASPIPEYRVHSKASYVSTVLAPEYRPRKSVKLASLSTPLKGAYYGYQVDALTPVLTYVIDDSGAGPVDTQQNLYATEADAVLAGTQLGYTGVTSYGFDTVVYVNGKPVVTKAYMYVVPTVTGRNCIVDLPINNNVIPAKWYVQGG